LLVLELLKYAATGAPPTPGDGVLWSLGKVGDRQVQWALDAGLGPLLYSATRGGYERVPAAWRDVLLSADLTARVTHGNLTETTNEVIDVCRDTQVPVTLLKGISISDQYYPAPHLRPMGDVDVLIPEDAYDLVETELLRRGYIRHPDYTLRDGAEHGIPLFDACHHVWVEIHTALFDRSRPGGVFSPAHISACSFPSTFCDRPVNRLTDELQLLYLAASWVQDLSHYDVKSHPSCLPPLFDAVYLLRDGRHALDHESLLGWRDDDMPIASLYVMLSYLSRRGIDLCTTQTLSLLGSSQNVVGASQCRFIYATWDYYLLGGRPWHLPLPPPVPGRYSVRHQLRKRRPLDRLMRKIFGLREGRQPS
jgi:hypothetical protein